MKMKLFAALTCSAAAILITLTSIQVRSVAQSNEAPARTIEGVWEVKKTPRNCTTGEPIAAAAFEAIYTYHSDGTLSDTSSSGTPLPFHGLWKRELGWSDYSFRQLRILRSPTTNLYSGKQEIGGTLKLSESGDEYTSNEYMIVFSIDGVPSTPACLDSVGTRFKLEE